MIFVKQKLTNKVIKILNFREGLTKDLKADMKDGLN
jgi:hypothetical protein